MLSRWWLGEFACLGFNSCEFFEVFVIDVFNEWLRLGESKDEHWLFCVETREDNVLFRFEVAFGVFVVNDSRSCYCKIFVKIDFDASNLFFDIRYFVAYILEILLVFGGVGFKFCQKKRRKKRGDYFFLFVCCFWEGFPYGLLIIFGEGFPYGLLM